MNFSFKTRGFTLIELLVVISIIGLLSSIVLSALQGTRKKAEDKNKLSTMLEYRKAILLAYDANGEYPDPGVGLEGSSFCVGDYVDNGCGWTNSVPESATINGIFDDYIALPKLKPIVGLSGNQNGNTFEGPFYQCTDNTTTSGICKAAYIRWFTDSSGSCGSAVSESYFGLNRCTFYFN